MEPLCVRAFLRLPLTYADELRQGLKERPFTFIGGETPTLATIGFDCVSIASVIHLMLYGEKLTGVNFAPRSGGVIL